MDLPDFQNNRVCPTEAASSELPPVALSVVIPVYNEVDNLDALRAELEAELPRLGLRYEIIYVNDGSRDGSREKLVSFAQARPGEVVVIDLRRNFGQTAAIAAGINYAHGAMVALLDADLQNDPRDLKQLIDKLNEGYDVVSGWRNRRRDVFLTRRLPSIIANGLISLVTDVHLHDYGCTLKIYRCEALSEMQLYGEMHRFMPVFAAAAGAAIAEVKVNHRPRLHGKSKYGLVRTYKVLLDLITVKFLLSYRTRPMYLFGGSGMILMTLGILILAASLLKKWLEGISLIQTPLPYLAATLFALGIQSILLGLTTELLMRNYFESQSKPIYVVRNIYDGRRPV